MAQPLSMDLRSRLLAAVDDGLSCRAAAARLGVAPSTAICARAGWKSGRQTSFLSEKRATTSRLRNSAQAWPRLACSSPSPGCIASSYAGA